MFGIEALQADAAGSAWSKRLHGDLGSQEEDISRGSSKRARVDSTGTIAADRSAGANRELDGAIAAHLSSFPPEQSRKQIETSSQLPLPAIESKATSSLLR